MAHWFLKPRNMKQERIGVLGSGIVGRVLASAFLQEGYEVMLSARSAVKDELLAWQQANVNGKIGTFADAAGFGNIVVLAVAGQHAHAALDLAGVHQLAGKLVIDATNPIDHNLAPTDGILSFFTGPNESLMEQLQAKVPLANFVKTFSCVGNALMYKPQLGNTRPTMFIAGNDPTAKQTVTDILTAFGWDTEDIGKAAGARAIEPLCILWCAPGFLRNQWQHAFKLLKN